MLVFPNEPETQDFQGLDDLPLRGITGKPAHQVATSASATNASRIADSSFSTSLPKVAI